MKLPLAALAFLLAASSASSASPRYSYDLNEVSQAAGKALKASGSKSQDFRMLGLQEQRGSAYQFLGLLREAHKANVVLAIADYRLEGIRDFVALGLEDAGNERFDGMTVIIVAPTKDEAMFEPLLGKRGIKVIFATY